MKTSEFLKLLCSTNAQFPLLKPVLEDVEKLEKMAELAKQEFETEYYQWGAGDFERQFLEIEKTIHTYEAAEITLSQMAGG